MSQDLDQNMVDRIAASVFKRHVRGGDFATLLEMEDLRHAGVIGLLEARKTFDPSQGEWQRFAGIRIRGAMLDRLRRQALVSVSQQRYRDVKALQEAEGDLKRQGSALDPDNLADLWVHGSRTVHKWSR